MNQISDIKQYAKSHQVPIMQDGGIDFICNYIKTHNVHSVLEIGTAIGYSSIRFAKSADDVKVVTLELDLDRFIKARQNISDNGLEDKITPINQDAAKYETDQKFDLIFIDGPKAQYIRFFEKFKNNLNEGGVIITDNLSFHGMVEDQSLTHNYSTIKLVRKIKKYVDFLKNNVEFYTEFYPFGDGISVSCRSKKIDKEQIFSTKLPDSKLDVELIAFDLDDTLLNSNLKISERTIKAIQDCTKKGIYIVLCSGRAENAILPFVRQLDIAGSQYGRYLIGINGASILDLHTRQPVYEQKLGSGILRLVHKEAAARGMGCHVCDADTIYADRDTEWTRKDSILCGLNFKVVPDFDEFMEKGHPKILVPAPEEEVAEFLPELKAKLQGRADVFTSKPFFLEVMPHNCGKGQAVLWLAGKLGIQRIKTMAFGDSFNDESMLTMVEYGVAMKNGQEHLKEVARFVTRATNNEDGIADFLETWVL